MLCSPEMVQKIDRELFISGDKCYFSCCGKTAEEVSMGAWSQRKGAGALLGQEQDLSHTGTKNICSFQMVSLCL